MTIQADEAAARVPSGTMVAAVLLSLLAVAIAYRYWPSDERAIRRHLVHLAEVLSVPGRESEVEHLTRVAALREYFAADVRVAAGGREIASRDELIGALMKWTPPPGGFTVETDHERVVLAPDRTTAEVALSARVISKDVLTGEPVVDSSDIEVSMAKVEGDWVITRAVTRSAGELALWR